MDAVAGNPAVKAGAPYRGNRLTKLVLAAVALGLALAVGGYAVRIAQNYTFHKERGFRVLQEVAAQFENFQGSLVTLLSVAPRGMKLEAQRTYISKLAIQDISLETVSLGEAFVHSQCWKGKSWGNGMFLAFPQVANAPFVFFSCPTQVADDVAQVEDGDTQSPPPCTLADSSPRSVKPDAAPSQSTQPARDARCMHPGLRGSFEYSLNGFVSQGFFDQVLLTTQGGAVLTQFGNSARDVARNTVTLQQKKSYALGMTNAAAVLRIAARKIREGDVLPAADSSKEAARVGADELQVFQPIVFPITVGDQSYRAFVLPFRPTFPLFAPDGSPAAGAGGPQRQTTLYVIGLKSANFQQDVSTALGPQGNFIAAVIILVVLFAWPLLSLRSRLREDPFTWNEIVACLLSILLIPAVLTAAALWFWSHQQLRAWADDGARHYAYDIRARLTQELARDAALLAMYRQFPFDNAEAEKQGYGFPIRAPTCTRSRNCPKNRTAWAQWCVQPGDITARPCGDRAGNMEDVRDDVGDMRWWSPLRLIYGVDDGGWMMRPRFTVFSDPPLGDRVPLKGREYFQVLEQGQGWSLKDAGRCGIGRFANYDFVAQRVFSKSDAARMLQIAIPRSGRRGDFSGIIAGSARVHQFTAPVAPLLLKFAVIDNDTGVVLFHSDDARSLSENFFVEAEQNERLRAAAATASAVQISGNYTGEPHRLTYVPMRNVPWGVVVFYANADLAELPSQAALTALTAYGGPVFCVLLLIAVAMTLYGRQRSIRLAKRVWPVGAASSSLEKFSKRSLLTFAGVAVACCLMLRLLVAAVVLVAVLTLVWMVIVRYRKQLHEWHAAIGLAFCVLALAAVPLVWLGLGYHDAQVLGFVRDGLLQARYDIEQRQAVMSADLRRWVPDAKDRKRRFPPLAELVQPTSELMALPGYRVQREPFERNGAATFVWNLVSFRGPPLIRQQPVRFGYWRLKSWAVTAESDAQERRIRMTQASAPVDGRTGNPDTQERSGFTHSGPVEQYQFVTSDGNTVKLRFDTAMQRIADPICCDDAVDTFDATLRAGQFRSYSSSGFSILAIATLTLLLCRGFIRRLAGAAAPAVAVPQGTPFARTSGNRAVVLRKTPPRTTEHRAVDPDASATSLLEAVGWPDPVTRAGVEVVDLATPSASASLGRPIWAPGRYVFLNFDVALANPGGSRELLNALSTLVNREDIELLLACRRSPFRRLHQPDAYPEYQEQGALSTEELMRWDQLLSSFTVMAALPHNSPPDTGVSPAGLNPAAYHAVWKLCTSTERIQLHQLASGRIANPRNDRVLGDLLAWGLIKYDPWPRIVDPGFEGFVQTAETPRTMLDLQRGAGIGSRKVVRMVVILMLLAAAVGISWAAGNTLKFATGILVAALAFVSQLTQAISLVRGANTGSK